MSDVPDVSEQKKAWRRASRDLFALMPRGERAELDAALCARLWEYARERAGRAGLGGTGLVLGYAAMQDEADVTPFLRRWLAEGGRVALPVWVNERDLTLREVTDFDVQTKAGRGGILEPVAGCPEVTPEVIDLVITPGRFFSERCARLGRGAGCYDQLLARSGLKSLGVAYDFQIVPALPTNGNDNPVDAVLTPTRLIARQTKSPEIANKRNGK